VPCNYIMELRDLNSMLHGVVYVEAPDSIINVPVQLQDVFVQISGHFGRLTSFRARSGP
jgi:hypothetical protein